MSLHVLCIHGYLPVLMGVLIKVQTLQDIQFPKLLHNLGQFLQFNTF